MQHFTDRFLPARHSNKCGISYGNVSGWLAGWPDR